MKRKRGQKFRKEEKDRNELKVNFALQPIFLIYVIIISLWWK